jgi:hypothetical protein
VRGDGDKGTGTAWRHVMTSGRSDLTDSDTTRMVCLDCFDITVTPAPHSGKCRDRDEVRPYLTHGTGLEHRSSRDVGMPVD